MTEAADEHGSNTAVERISGSQLKLWLLFEANRWIVAAAILAVVYGALVVLGKVDPVPLRTTMQSTDPVETLFQAMVTGIITGVTLVVSINQVVLSQELGPLGDQRERMEGAMAFREDVEDVLGEPVSPDDPSSFLRALVDLTGTRTKQLEEAVGEGHAPEIRDRVDDYVDDVVGNAETVSDDLSNAKFGNFDVLSAALDFNYSWKLYEARRLRHDHEEALSDEACEALDGVIDALQLFAPAREHVKTLYFQWALVDLSRAMLYSAIPALIVAVAGILYLSDPGSITGTTIGVDNMIWTVSAAVVVTLAPFAILTAYVLRIATVAKRTLAIGPFVLRDSDRSGKREI